MADKKTTTQAAEQAALCLLYTSFCHEFAVAAVRGQACRFDFGTFNLHHIYALLVKPALPPAHY